MSNLHRLQWIDEQIRTGRFPNTRGLAEQFEISRRQALRDFEYLRDTLGAPLAYSAIRRGYTYTSGAFTLPGVYVTGQQRQLLSHLAQYYDGVANRDSRFAAAYADMADLFKRLGGKAKGALTSEPEREAVPYRVVLTTDLAAPPAQLAPFWRGQAGPGQVACECHDVRPFLSALLAAGAPVRIAWPRWVRERLERYLHRFLAAQVDTTRHVTPSLVSCDQQPELAGRQMMMMSQETRRVVTDARFAPMWMSYAGSALPVLKAAGMTDLDMTRFMGLTGMAFHTIWHEECCVSSVTVYDWVGVHRAGLDRIGVLTEIYEAMPDSPTYEPACRRAVTQIKAALDRGVGVILWGVDTGEFGVVYGYDDDDGVFLVSGCMDMGPGGSQPVLYENVGKTFAGAPILFCQAPVDRAPYDRDRAHRSSLEYYVNHMEATFHASPAYKSGLRGYDNWIRALQSGKFAANGLRYNSTVYAEAKGFAADYMAILAAEWNAKLQPAAATFRRIADLYGQMMQVLGHRLDGPVDLNRPVSAEEVTALLPLVQAARELEVVALAQVKLAL
jgi:hypothetical protein